MPLLSHIVRTPLLAYRGDRVTTGRVFLKPENLQPLGAYKIRGVAAAVRAATPERLAGGIHTASSGNMAQSVAFAAGLLGLPCRVYVPQTAPQVKKQSIRRLGARLMEIPFETAWASVRGDVVLDPEGLFLHPARTETLVAGYASLVEEIVADLPEVDAIVAPFGVGGLTLGLARALARLNPRPALYTVEAETAAPMHAAMAAGRPLWIERQSTFVDSIGTPEVLPEVYRELAPVLAGARTASIHEAEAAVARLLREHRMVVEGAGACALVAAEQLAREGRHERIVCILTGGNIDEPVLWDILKRHRRCGVLPAGTPRPRRRTMPRQERQERLA